MTAESYGGVPMPAEVHEYRVHAALVPAPQRATVAAALRRWARVAPDRPYLTWCSVEAGTDVLTFGDLDRRSAGLAEALLQDMGATRSLALVAGNDVPSVLTIFAALRAGVPCTLLSPNDPAARLREILARHGVAKVVRSPFAPAGAAQVAEVIPDPPPAAGGDSLDACVPAGSPALLFGTSGSTAASKLVVQPHRALTSNAEAVRRHHGLNASTTLMGGLPLHHVNGVHFTLLAPLYAGAHVVLPQELSPFEYPRLLDTYRPHLASVVPTMLEALLARRSGRRLPDSLRYFVSAAAPLSNSLLRRFVRATGVRVLQGYGLSETTNFSTTVPADLSEQVYREVALDADLPSVGVPLYGNEVETLFPDGKPCGEGVVGEICMRGHNVMLGYEGRQDLTAEAFAGGWFHSGDLGYWARAGDGRRYFYVSGRSKNVAKVRGESVSLEEVERALLALDGVSDAACAAVPHPTWGEQLVALVRTHNGADLATLRIRLAAVLPAVAVPSSWRHLDAIPRTATGKLLRPQLAELARWDVPE